MPSRRADMRIHVGTGVPPVFPRAAIGPRYGRQYGRKIFRPYQWAPPGVAKFAGAENVGEMTAPRTPAHFATPRNGNGSKTLAGHARKLKNHNLLENN